MPDTPRVGPVVEDRSADATTPVDTLPGPGVTLRRPEPRADAAVLHPLTHGSVEAEDTWTHMGYGPWPDPAAMRAWIDGCREATDTTWYTVLRADGAPIGMTAFLNHVPVDRRIEIGHIWYIPEARRTTANTEAVLLMARHAFGSLACRRLEWKCDALNQVSRAAADRLGFTFEGVFRQHMIVKGRNRDTAWYSIIDSEWPAVEAALHTWLFEDPRDRQGKPVRSLSEVRDSLRR